MTIFLDCEFNGFDGELISIAMVSDDGAPKHELYAVRKPPESPTPWVQEHVLPVLGKRPVSDATLQRQVLDYLGLRNRQTIVADWPKTTSTCCTCYRPPPATPTAWSLQCALCEPTPTSNPKSRTMPYPMRAPSCSGITASATEIAIPPAFAHH